MVAQLTKSDSYLNDYKDALHSRYSVYSIRSLPTHLPIPAYFPVACDSALAGKLVGYLDQIDAHGGGLDAFSQGYKWYGFNRAERDGVNGIMYREWAPNASRAALVGDFNGWDTTKTPMIRNEYVRHETACFPQSAWSRCGVTSVCAAFCGVLQFHVPLAFRSRLRLVSLYFQSMPSCSM